MKKCPDRGGKKRRAFFPLYAFRSELYTKHSSKSSGKRKMMNEAEYYEWAETAAAGKLTKQEAKAEWQAFMADKNVKKDKRGPRGMERCNVTIGDSDTSGDEHGAAQRFSGATTMKKQPNQKETENYMNMLVSGHSQSFDSESKLCAKSISERLAEARVAGRGDSNRMFDGDQLVISSLRTVGVTPSPAKKEKEKRGERKEQDSEGQASNETRTRMQSQLDSAYLIVLVIAHSAKWLADLVLVCSCWRMFYL